MPRDFQLDETPPHKSAFRASLSRKLNALARTVFGTLFLLFLGRMFHGSSDADDGQLDLGPGVIAILLAMPGLLVSLLMFEKYGSLMAFLNGGPHPLRSLPRTA